MLKWIEKMLRRLRRQAGEKKFEPSSDERAIGWHCYLDDKLRFPFNARCIAVREISPLKKGEKVEVLGMAPEDDCMKEMFVLVGFAGRELGVPLVQLDPVRPDKATRAAMSALIFSTPAARSRAVSLPRPKS